MTAWFKKSLGFLSIPIALWFLGCAQGIQKSGPQDLYNNLSMVNVCAIYPEAQWDETRTYLVAKNVPIDSPIFLTFDSKIDAYSATPENILILDSANNPVPLKAADGEASLISNFFSSSTAPTCPQDREVSVVRIDTGMLEPQMEYRVMWKQGQGGKRDPNDTRDPSLIGIRGINGSPVSADGFFIQTGKSDHLTAFNNGFFEVLGMAPGRLISKADSTSTIFDAIGNAITVNAKAPFSVFFNDRFKHSIYDAGKTDLQLSTEIPRTPLQKVVNGQVVNNFPGTSVIVLDANTPLNEFLDSIPDLSKVDPANWGYAWSRFNSRKLQRPLRMNVRSTEGRTKLIFELEENCDDPEVCLYPENKDPKKVAQVVVVLLQGWESAKTKKGIRGGFAVGGFFHYSGFSIDAGFKPMDALKKVIR